MTLVIGLDTGGTFTDAALLDSAAGTVLGTGKSLTTREDLSIGVGGAIARVLEGFDGAPAISALSRCRRRWQRTPASKVSAGAPASS